MSSKQDEARGTVTLERGGQTFEGHYIYADEWVTVTYGGRSKGGAVHEAPPGTHDYEFIARMLLSELAPRA